MKNYLKTEGERNRRNAALFERLMRLALSSLEPGSSAAVIVGHHLTFELNGDLETENELASADTLMFDHDFMRAAFGDDALGIMEHLASTPVDTAVGTPNRDNVLGAYLNRAEITSKMRAAG